MFYLALPFIPVGESCHDVHGVLSGARWCCCHCAGEKASARCWSAFHFNMGWCCRIGVHHLVHRTRESIKSTYFYLKYKTIQLVFSWWKTKSYFYLLLILPDPALKNAVAQLSWQDLSLSIHSYPQSSGTLPRALRARLETYTCAKKLVLSHSSALSRAPSYPKDEIGLKPKLDSSRARANHQKNVK